LRRAGLIDQRLPICKRTPISPVVAVDLLFIFLLGPMTFERHLCGDDI
jgi:hypothetical protein